jgi:hypothetical protein
LTVGPGITVRTGGAAGTLGAAAHGLVNQGTVSAQTASRTLLVLGNTVTNDGLMEARTSATLNVNASTAFTNRGRVVAEAGGAVTFVGALTQDGNAAAETRVVGTLSATAVDIRTGTLTGTGTVSAPVTNQARVAPGLSAGVLTVGSYNQTAAGVLALEVGGTTRGTQYDVLVTDSITMNGTVKVDLIGGFVPSAGQSFDVLDWTGGFGGSPTFDFSGAGLPNGLGWDMSSFAVNGTIQVIPVPEPGVLIPLAIAAGVCAWRRRQRLSCATSSGIGTRSG